MEIIKELEESKLLPIITLRSEESIDIIGEVIKKSNIKLIEVAYRSELASKAIKRYSKIEGKIIGAGTIKNLSQAKEAVSNGAKFLVSPGFDDEVVSYANDNSIPVFPGVLTPTEILNGINKHNLSIFKLFPANLIQGLDGIKALGAPFYEIKFVPTGGINGDNYLEFLKNKQIIAVGGSFIINDSINKEEVDNEIKKINNLISAIE